MTQHILVATDGSELADKAVIYAVELAAELSAQVTAVTVSESWSPLNIGRKDRIGQLQAIAEFEGRAAEAAEKILSQVRELASHNKVKIKTIHISDVRPAEGIIRVTEDEGCDLIVMASHGRRGVSRLLLGSQAQEVLSNSKVPVLICK